MAKVVATDSTANARGGGGDKDHLAFGGHMPEDLIMPPPDMGKRNLGFGGSGGEYVDDGHLFGVEEIKNAAYAQDLVAEAGLSTPAYFRDKFFFTEYGVTVVEKDHTTRTLLLELIVYTFFVFMWVFYVYQNIEIESALGVHRAITEHLVEATVTLTTTVGKEESILGFDVNTERSFSFGEIHEVGEFYRWVDTIFLGAGGPYNPATPGFIGGFNRVVGRIRLRQARSKSNSPYCTLPENT